MKTISLMTSVAAVALISACSPLTTAQAPGPSTNVIERAKDMQAVLAFNECSQDGKMKDVAAASAQDQALYLSSADTLAGCDRTLDEATQLIAQRDRMQVSALAVQNYLKGGDVAKARLALDEFQARFGPDDLIYADGSSFTDTMHALLFQHEQPEQLALSTLNAKAGVKDEIRRAWYWQQN
jgi:hypothetical protein